jgi:hypothetical protein
MIWLAPAEKDAVTQDFKNRHRDAANPWRVNFMADARLKLNDQIRSLNAVRERQEESHGGVRRAPWND